MGWPVLAGSALGIGALSAKGEIRNASEKWDEKNYENPDSFFCSIHSLIHSTVDQASECQGEKN